MRIGLPGAIVAAALTALLPSGGQAADRIKVGFISTLSGPSAALGVDIRDGFQLAVKMAGGRIGGLPAEVLVGDDQFKPDVGRQLAEKNVRLDKVNFLTGMVFSNIMLASVPVAFENKIIYVSPNAAPSPFAGKQCNPYLFVASWPNDAYHEAAGQHATNRGYKSAYLIAPNYQAGKDSLTGFKRFYKGNVAAEVYTQLGQLDYSAELAQVRAAKPDALYIFLLIVSYPRIIMHGGIYVLLAGPTLEGLLGGVSTYSATVHAYISDVTSDGSRVTAFTRIAAFLMMGFFAPPGQAHDE